MRLDAPTARPGGKHGNIDKPAQGSIEEVHEMALDPVCKMDVDPKHAPAQAEYKGKTYYFCAPGCKAAFDKDPEKYLKAAEETK